MDVVLFKLGINVASYTRQVSHTAAGLKNNVVLTVKNQIGAKETTVLFLVQFDTILLAFVKIFCKLLRKQQILGTLIFKLDYPLLLQFEQPQLLRLALVLFVHLLCNP